MPLTRRYLFHGHAAALGGRILRVGERTKAKAIPDAFIDLPGSVLTVAGGQSTVDLSPEQLSHPLVKSFVRFKRARTQATGTFDNTRGHFDSTLTDTDAATLNARTTVQAEVEGLEVGLSDDVRMIVGNVRGGFTSTAAAPGQQTPVTIDPATGFADNRITFVTKKGVSYTLKVEVDLDPFNQNPTQDGLVGASRSVKFLAAFGHVLHLAIAGAKPKARAKAKGRSATAPSRPSFTRTDSGDIVGTIVKPLTWDGKEFPGSVIDPKRPNRVMVPGIGTLSLGELVIGSHTKRLTMVRGELGSQIGADFAAVDVQDNGGLSL